MASASLERDYMPCILRFAALFGRHASAAAAFIRHAHQSVHTRRGLKLRRGSARRPCGRRRCRLAAVLCFCSARSSRAVGGLLRCALSLGGLLRRAPSFGPLLRRAPSFGPLLRRAPGAGLLLRRAPGTGPLVRGGPSFGCLPRPATVSGESTTTFTTTGI